MEKSMTDQSRKSSPEISKDSPRCISSPEEEDGRSPCDLQDGPTTDLFGQPAHLVRLSVPQEKQSDVQRAKARILCGALEELATQYAQTAKQLGLPMPATFGRRPGGSSPSADLSMFLVSRLLNVPDLYGSPLYKHQWKCSLTLLGQVDYLCRASGRRTCDIDASGWPTPNATDGSKAPAKFARGNLSLPGAAKLTGWPTPNAMPKSRGGLQANPEAAARRREQGHQLNLDDAVCLIGWSTPTAMDGRRGNKPPRPHDTGVPLDQQVALAGWPTHAPWNPISTRKMCWLGRSA